MVTIFENKEEITIHASDIFTAAAQNAIKQRGRFVVALTGGSSPISIYQLLATSPYRDKIDWNLVFVFWGDERWVPLDDELSNAKMSCEYLLDHVGIPKANIFPMYESGVKPQDYAAHYEQSIKNVLGEDGKFDLILLGMGDDGHTASLFPAQPVLQENTKWVSAYYLASQNMYRITLTVPLINKAREIMVVTFGANKLYALNEVLYGEYNPQKYPMQLIKPLDGKLLFVTDKAAAGTNQ